MARPLKEVDEKMVQNLARIHCSYKEIASLVGVTQQTLIENYGDMIEECRDMGKMGLRRSLFQQAEKGSLHAMIWLSKNILGMSDKVVTASVAMDGFDSQKQQELALMISDLNKAYDLEKEVHGKAQSDTTEPRGLLENERKE